MGKSILLGALAILVPFTGLAWADDAPGSIDLVKWLDASDSTLRVEGFKPTTEIMIFEPGKKPYFYVRLLPAIDVIDGGPDVGDPAAGDNSYKDAFGGGYGFNIELHARFVPNIYLFLQFGASRFEGGRGMTTYNGYDYHLSDMSMTYLTIGGAFAAPIENIYKDLGAIEDTEGLIANILFCAGVVLTPEVDMYVDASPIGLDDLTGRHLDFWEARIGFVGHAAIGIEYRVGPFALIADLGVRTFGKPISATVPRDWSTGQAMVTYPIRFGASYRF